MENVILSVHLIIALILIGVVLLQRSEGGGLGMGGGGGNISGRPPTTPMAKLTWIFAAAFIVTSVTLTILAARDAAQGSVADQVPVTTEAPAETGGSAVPGLKAGDDLLPPGTADAPAVPSTAEPVTPPPTTP
jgi:preprotein translocase subunit SecG